MPKDRVVQQWNDGHVLMRDTRQWIVSHPATCANSRRGPRQRAPKTFFRHRESLQEEAVRCGIRLQA